MFQLDSLEQAAKNAPNDKLNVFMGKAVGDIGAALSANMVLLGDKFSLYKVVAKAGPVTPAELAR